MKIDKGPEAYKNELFSGFLENVFGHIIGRNVFDFSKVVRKRVLGVISAYRNKWDFYKYTLITHAISKNLFFIVKLCVEKGYYNISHRDCHGNTYLHWCYYYKREKMLRYFIEKGLDAHHCLNKYELLPSSNTAEILLYTTIRKYRREHFITFRLNKREHKRISVIITTCKVKDVIHEISRTLFSNKVGPRFLGLSYNGELLKGDDLLMSRMNLSTYDHMVDIVISEEYTSGPICFRTSNYFEGIKSVHAKYPRVKTAPLHRVVSNGLSIEYECSHCKKLVMVNVGYSTGGTNEIRVGEIQYDKKCTNSKCKKLLLESTINRIVFSFCRVEYNGFSSTRKEKLHGVKVYPLKYTPRAFMEVKKFETVTFLNFIVLPFFCSSSQKQKTL